MCIVTGKGGVGKTTTTVALALALAAENKRVLVTMCQAKERWSTLFDTQDVGTDVVQVMPNISAVNMQPDKALEEYGQMTLHSKTLYSLLFDNAYVRAFFRAAPGIQGWSMLGKAWWHTTEVLPSGAPKYDVVILDAPATGHGLEMLRIPKIIVDLAPTGILRRDAESALRLFQNPKETSIYVVTLPEELPTTETLELSRVLQRELGMTLTKIVMNGVAPTLFSEQERASFLRWTIPRSLPQGAFALVAARTRAARENLLVQSRARLQTELPVPIIELPLLLGRRLGAPELRKLATFFAPA